MQDLTESELYVIVYGLENCNFPGKLSQHVTSARQKAVEEYKEVKEEEEEE